MDNNYNLRSRSVVANAPENVEPQAIPTSQDFQSDVGGLPGPSRSYSEGYIGVPNRQSYAHPGPQHGWSNPYMTTPNTEPFMATILTQLSNSVLSLADRVNAMPVNSNSNSAAGVAQVSLHLPKFNGHERQNYQWLCRALRQQYCSVLPDGRKEQLLNRVRKSNEKIEDLSDDLWHLSCEAYPDLPYELQERMALDAFKRAVSKELRLRLVDRGVSTLRQAVQTAQLYESVVGTSGSHHSVRAVSPYPSAERRVRFSSSSFRRLSRGISLSPVDQQ